MARWQKRPFSFYDRGFTLIEILAAIAIMSILAAIAIPNWNTLLPTYALNSAARQVQSELHNLKSRAAKENTSFQFNVASAPTGNYEIQRASATQVTKPLPEGIEVTETVNISFSARGTANSETVKLRNNKLACVFVIVSGTGRIRMCKPSSCSATTC